MLETPNEKRRKTLQGEIDQLTARLDKVEDPHAQIRIGRELEHARRLLEEHDAMDVAGQFLSTRPGSTP